MIQWYRTDFRKERGGRRDSHEEFGGIDRAYGIARRVPRADERRGGHRSPPAPAARIEESRGKSKKAGPAGGPARLQLDSQRFPENVAPDDQKIGIDEPTRGGGVYVGQDPRAEERCARLPMRWW